jgi:hypothetical protein
MVVISADQTKRVDLVGLFFCGRILLAVVMKLADPKIDLTPARWREKIAISTDGPLWAETEDRGGYTVQPVPAPLSTRDLLRRRNSAGRISQNLRLFIRGNVISGDASIKGISQFPKAPIRTGITKKKIIKKA